MKVVFITHYTQLYGANRSLLNLIEGLNKLNVESIVLCPKHGELTEELTCKSVPFLVLPYYNWVYNKNEELLKLPFKIVLTFLLLPYYIYKISKVTPDIIYSNTSVTGIGALIAQFIKVPHIWHVRELLKEDYGLQYFFGNGLVRRLFNKSDYIITISNYLFHKRISNFTPPKEVIYNGVISCSSISGFRNIDNKKSITLGIVGRIHPPKNQLEAIKAFYLYNKKLDNARLRIIGDGPPEHVHELKQECFKLGIDDKVDFTGYIKNTETIYKETDILLMCSRTEGMGRVTVEAMARGIPVIGYNGSATPELVDHNINGFLYNDNEVDLCQKLILLVNNPDLYKKFSQSSVKKASENFTLENYSKKIYLIMKKVTSKAK